MHHWSHDQEGRHPGGVCIQGGWADPQDTMEYSQQAYTAWPTLNQLGNFSIHCMGYYQYHILTFTAFTAWVQFTV